MNLLEIKTLPIKDVIDRIGLEYTGWPVERKIKENWQPTSGWTFNTSKNLAKDFSKDRPDWHNFWVVKTHFNLTDSETYKRFEDNFGTGEKESWKPSITQIWKWLHDLDQNQKQYLAKRFIDYELVKDCVKSYNWAIWCMVYDWELPMGINCRRINSTGKDDRFVSYPWYPTSGVYKSWIDSKIKKIYVVEWLIDFLSLR